MTAKHKRNTHSLNESLIVCKQLLYAFTDCLIDGTQHTIAFKAIRMQRILQRIHRIDCNLGRIDEKIELFFEIFLFIDKNLTMIRFNNKLISILTFISNICN